MKYDVYNINQIIRRTIIEEFSEILSYKRNGYSKYLKYMNDLIEEDINTYKIIISALYPAFYLENSINLMENEAFREYEDELDDEVLEEYDSYVIAQDELDSISNIEELVSYSLEESKFLPLLLENNEIFYSRSYLEKRSLLLDIGHLDKYFCQICPSFIFEKMDCCMELTSNDVIDLYNFLCESSLCLSDRAKEIESAGLVVEFLSTLSLYDTDNFNSIMSCICTSTRKYMDFLSYEEDLNKFDLHFINMYDDKSKKGEKIKRVLYTNIINDSDIANNFVMRFLQYSFMDEDIKSKIDGEDPGQKRKIK